MRSRRFVITAAAGSGAAAAVFFLQLDKFLDAQEWGRAALLGVGFGIFMAAWNGLLIRADRQSRTTRNIIFEHAVGEFVALIGVAWLLLDSVGHLRWQDLAWYTIGGLPLLALVYLLTRRHIRGESADELFA